MPARRIIPCLDVKGGRVVKGVRFEGLRDLGDPVALAQRYDAEGADELVFLDISATEERRSTQGTWVKAVARSLSIPFTVGGGVASVDDARALLRAGADKVAVNSAAVARPELIQELAAVFGAQCVVAAVDLKRDAEVGWRVFVAGGKRATDFSAREWLPASWSSARASFSLRAWTGMARAKASTWTCCAWLPASACRSSPLAARDRKATSSTPSTREPMPCSPRRSSTKTLCPFRA